MNDLERRTIGLKIRKNIIPLKVKLRIKKLICNLIGHRSFIPERINGYHVQGSCSYCMTRYTRDPQEDDLGYLGYVDSKIFDCWFN